MTIDCKFLLRSGSDKEMKAIQDKQALVVYMLHAGRCLKREETLPPRCTRTECSGTKELLRHVKDCNQKRNCDYPKCTEMRKIAAHWMQCGHRQCAVCGPIVKGLRKLRKDHEERESELIDVETVDEQAVIQNILDQRKFSEMMAKIKNNEYKTVAQSVNVHGTDNEHMDENNNVEEEKMEVDE